MSLADTANAVIRRAEIADAVAGQFCFTPERYAAEAARTVRAEAAFWGRHPGLREYRPTTRNVLKLFQSSGAPLDECRRLAGCLTSSGNLSPDGICDHGSIHGRLGSPLLLIGHPYRLHEDDRILLGQIGGLGLRVEIGLPGDSFYGYGTVQVLVYSTSYRPPSKIRQESPAALFPPPAAEVAATN